MQFIAYYAHELDSKVLEADMKRALSEHLDVPTEVAVQCASHCSTAIYIAVLAQSATSTVEHIVKVLRNRTPVPSITVVYSEDSVFEVKEAGGGYFNLFKTQRPPTIRRILYAVVSTEKGTSDYLVVHGSNLHDTPGVAYFWRFSPNGELNKLTPIHAQKLMDRNVLQLVAKKDSIAFEPPALQAHCPNESLSIEAWRDSRHFGNCVEILVSELVLGVPPGPVEQERLRRLSCWKTTSASCAAPSVYEYDVFISHAGGDADKHLARALQFLLEAGWDLRVFLDDDSQRATTDPTDAVRAAMRSSQIALLFFSNGNFQREATLWEFTEFVQTHAEHHVQLFPVYLRLTEEECADKIAEIIPTGFKMPTGFRHQKEISPHPDQEGLPKSDSETLWHIASEIVMILHKDYSSGVHKYSTHNRAASS